MKWSDYFGAKAAELCFYAIAIIVWGVFAFLTGANPALLWGSIGFFVSAIAVRLGIGFVSARNRIAKLEKLKNGLDEKYLIGELIPKPHDAVAESAKREKNEYYDYVEKWIHEIKTPLTACSLICDNGGNTEKLRRELKKADNLTDTILQYARLRTPQNDTKISKLRVSDAIEEAVQSQRELLIASKISVSVNGDFCIYTESGMLHAQAAFDKLRQILRGLSHKHNSRRRRRYRGGQRSGHSVARASAHIRPRFYGRARQKRGHGHGAFYSIGNLQALIRKARRNLAPGRRHSLFVRVPAFRKLTLNAHCVRQIPIRLC